MREVDGNTINTISDLRNFYRDSVPYSCKYRIEINFPESVKASMGSAKLNIACQSAEIPRASVKTQKVYYRGRPLNLKGQLAFEEAFKVTIQDNGHFDVRRELEKWLAACDNLSGDSLEDYKIDEVYLYHLDCYGKPTVKTTFYGVFLTELGGMQLSDRSAEAITYDCSFTYSICETTVL